MRRYLLNIKMKGRFRCDTFLFDIFNKVIYDRDKIGQLCQFAALILYLNCFRKNMFYILLFQILKLYFRKAFLISSSFMFIFSSFAK